MKKRVVITVSIIMFLFLINFVLAESISEDLHLNLQTTDDAGKVITGTFSFYFNISTTENCNNVIYSNYTDLTTDARGIISYYLPDVSLDYNQQYYLCYYRDGALKDSSKIARVPYTFTARNITLSGVAIDTNLDMGSYNISAAYFIGSGKYLTDLNVSALNMSNYVPFLGALLNLNLGDNNFTVNGTTFFVNTNNSRVGIGTITPFQKLHVAGNILANGTINATTDVCIQGGACLSTVAAAGEPLWTANYTAFNASWSSTFNQTTNDSINNYIVSYVGIQNESLVNYIGTVNTSMQNYVDSTFVNQSEIGNLSVNNTEYLDGYDSGFFMPLNQSVYGQFDFNGGWQGDGLSIIGGNLFAQMGYFYNISSLSVTNLNINGSLYPIEGFDNQFDIGTPTLRWKDLYLGGNAYINGSVYADYFIGNGSQLTGIRGSQIANDLNWINATTLSENETDPKWTANYTAFNASWSNTTNMSYVPYTGANQNVDLGANNFIVDTNTLVVDSVNNLVGIGRVPEVTTPPRKLQVYDNTEYGTYFTVGNANATGYVAGAFMIVSDNSARGGAYLNYNSVTKGTWGFGVRYSDPTYYQVGFVADGSRAPFYQSQTLVAENAIMTFRGDTKDVGIGTTSPDYKLDVRARMGITSDDAGLWIRNASEGEAWFIGRQGTTDPDLRFYYGGEDKVTIQTNGNVGIGTTSPFERLHVNGNILANGTINATTDVCIQGGACLSTVAAAGEPLWTANYSDFNASWSTTYNATVNASITNFITSNNQSIVNYISVQNTSLVNYIGTVNTSMKNYVDSQGFGTGTVNGSGTAWYIPMWNGTKTLNNSVIYQNGSNIGIGTTSPANIFEVNGTARAGKLILVDPSQVSNLPVGSPLAALHIRTASNIVPGIFISWTPMDITYPEGENLQIGEWNGTNFTERLRISGQGVTSGNVGIGTTNPFQKLHVNGSILANGTINATTDVCIEGGVCLSNVDSTGNGVNPAKLPNSTFTSPAEISRFGWNEGNGLYYINPGGKLASAVQVYVDFTTLDKDGETGWMLVASFTPDYEWSASHLTTNGVLNSTALDLWSSNFGNFEVKDVRIQASSSVDLGATNSTGDWYYHSNASLAWKEWWASASGTGNQYLVGAAGRWGLKSFEYSYNLKFNYLNANHKHNGLSDTSGVWPDFWTALTTSGQTLNVNGVAGDGSFGWSHNLIQTGQDIGSQQAAVGIDDSGNMACYGDSATYTGCGNAGNITRTTNLWIWVKGNSLTTSGELEVNGTGLSYVAGNFKAGTTTSGSPTMTVTSGTVNLSANVNLTMNGGNKISSNVTCIKIQGPSSILEIC